PQQPQHMLLEFPFLLQTAVALCHFRLRLELLEVSSQFAQNVLHANQVFTGVSQPIGSFPASLLVARNAGCFFQEDSQLFGLGLDEAIDHALANDGIAPGAKPCSQKYVVNVPAADLLPVNVITAVAIASEHAAHRQLGIRSPLARNAALAIVEHQFN